MTSSESEYGFAGAVVQLAHLNGWRVCQVRAARTEHGWRTPFMADGKGWPDIFAVKPGRAVALELKAQGGQLRPDQRAWLDALEAAGIAADCYRPRDWDRLMEVLR